MSVLQSRRVSDFSKGVSPWLSWKFKIYSFFGFGQNIDLQLLFADVLDQKKVLSEYKNVHFTESHTSDFSKGVNPCFKLKN